MNKLMAFFKSRYLYITLFFGILIDVGLQGPLEKKGFFLVLYQYLGQFVYVIAFLLFIHILLSFLRRKTEKPLFPLSIEFTVIGLLCCYYLYGMLRLRIPFEAARADETLLRDAMDFVLFRNQGNLVLKDMGLIPAYLFYLLLSKLNFLVIYGGLLGLALLSWTVVLFWPIGREILGIYRDYVEKEALEAKKRALLREQIERERAKEAKRLKELREIKGLSEHIRIKAPAPDKPASENEKIPPPKKTAVRPSNPLGNLEGLSDPFTLFAGEKPKKKRKK
ncbi:MAG: hypothetical protein LBQ97_09520 [Fusobacteriaceae bacterium]|jgi:hypothetical protein|nr:hypothetical protein [Fusobacteriaceae bacterium]